MIQNDIPTRNLTDSNKLKDTTASIYNDEISSASSNNLINPNVTAQDKLLTFVNEQIDKMKSYDNLGKNQSIPGFFELNEALMSYSRINCSLISLEVLAKSEAYTAREAFDDWLADKYYTVRNILNPSTLAATKWSSSKEIEMYIRSNYKEEYKTLKANADAADMKVAYMRRTLDQWSDYKFILNRICRNIEVEATKLGGGLIDDPT